MRASVLGCLLLILLSGCRSRGTVAPDATGAPLPSLEAIVSAQNGRVVRLDRIWARTVVQLEYEDESGRRRSVQGEGHLQVIQPNRLALSVGKLGETLYWLGADAERHWAIELGDLDRAMIGRHANVGLSCMRSIGAPVHPLDLLELMGARAMSTRETLVGLTEDGLIEVKGPVHSGERTLWLDPSTLLPVRVMIESANPAVGAITAELSDYEGVVLSDEGGFFPLLPSRIIAVHAASASRVQIDLSDMNDGSRRGRLTDAAFTFDSLVRALGPTEVIVLDESCAQPALTPDELAKVMR